MLYNIIKKLLQVYLINKVVNTLVFEMMMNEIYDRTISLGNWSIKKIKIIIREVYSIYNQA